MDLIQYLTFASGASWCKDEPVRFWNQKFEVKLSAGKSIQNSMLCVDFNRLVLYQLCEEVRNQSLGCCLLQLLQ